MENLFAGNFFQKNKLLNYLPSFLPFFLPSLLHCLLACLFACLFACLIPHSLTYSLTHSLTHPPTQPPTHPPTHPLTHSLTPSLARSLTHSLTHSMNFKDIETLKQLDTEQADDKPLKFSELLVKVWYKIVEKKSLIEGLYRQAFILTLDDKERNRFQCWTTDSLFKKITDLVIYGLFMKSVGFKQIGKQREI